MPVVLLPKGEQMKNSIVRIVFLIGLLFATGPVPVQADTSPVPLCYPRPCTVK
jgi:hypothetical protein